MRPLSASHAFGLAALGLISLAPVRALATEATVLPGYWESDEKYSLALLAGGSHARKCLSSTQVAQFTTAPQTSHYTCTYKSRHVADGTAMFRGGSCFTHKGRLVLGSVDVDGRYAPESFHLDFHFHFMVSPTAGLPGTAQIDAHRVSAQCPAEPSPPK